MQRDCEGKACMTKYDDDDDEVSLCTVYVPYTIIYAMPYTVLCRTVSDECPEAALVAAEHREEESGRASC